MKSPNPSGGLPALELSLPDLPDVHVGLGALPEDPDQPSRRVSGTRWADRLSQAMPVALMLVLALGSWWLVRNAPRPPEVLAPMAPSTEPDYLMTRFSVSRYDAQGQLSLKLAGEELRHVPATQQIVVQQLRLQAFAPDGRVTRAQSLRGLSDDQARHLILEGQAQITTPSSSGQTAVLEGQRLEIFPQDRVLSSQQSVRLRYAGHVVDSEGLRMDQNKQVIDLTGKTRAVLAMAPGRAP